MATAGPVAPVATDVGRQTSVIFDNIVTESTTDDCEESPSSSSPSSSEQSSQIDTPPASPVLSSEPIRLRPSPCGQKYKLLHEGDIQLCRLNHTRTIVSKIMNSRYLRRWESHHLVLNESDIYSLTVSYICFCLL